MEIRKNSTGRGVFTLFDIPKGSHIAVEKPLLYVEKDDFVGSYTMKSDGKTFDD